MSSDKLAPQQPPAPRIVPASNAGKILAVLFLANLLNYFDRVIPSVVIEPIRLEFGLTDTQLGLLTSAFTIVYALAGIPLGRLADRAPRRYVIGAGLAVWSLFTAGTAIAVNYWTLLLARLGVGVGEASYAPAATSMIADLYPSDRRSRATGIFMLGLPVGLILGFFTIGSIAEAFGSWRAPFVIAAVPGLLLAVVFLFIREPARGASEEVAISAERVDRPLRRVLSIPTVWCLIGGLLGYNFAAYAVNAWTVPLLQRYYGLELTQAALLTGVIVGITGLIGLTAGGQLADRADRRSSRHRLLVGAVSVSLAAPLCWFALTLGPGAVGAFTVIFALGWLASYVFYTTALPAMADVVEPRLRATGMAMLFAVSYILGGASGPILVGALSDRFAAQAAEAAGAATPTTEHLGIGLHDALLWLVPVGLVITAISMFLATRTVTADRERMLAACAATPTA